MDCATQSLCPPLPTFDSGLNGLAHTTLNVGILLQHVTLPVHASVRPPKPPGFVQRKVALGQQVQTLLVIALSQIRHGPVEVLVSDVQVLSGL